MKTEFLTLLFIAGVTATAQARLGETPDQLVARYGQPLTEVDQKAEGTKVALANVVFQKGGFEIDVSLSDGLSVQESFKKINGQPMTVAEVKTLLAANSQGYGWEAPDEKPQGRVWKRDDGATATAASDGSLTIKTREIIVKETAAKKEEQSPSLQGF